MMALRFRVVAAVVSGVLLAACAGGDETSTVDTSSTALSTASSTALSTASSTALSTASSTASSAAPSTAPSTAPDGTDFGIVVGHDGLAVATFGQPAEEVMATLTGLLGPPDWEEVQVSPDVDLSVQWDDPFLYLQFTHWDHFDPSTRPDPAPPGPIFHYYLTTSHRFATEAGITAGSTVAELEAAYPGVVFHQMCEDLLREFRVDPPSPGWPQLPLIGLIDGEVDDPATRIVHLGAGWDRTPC